MSDFLDDSLDFLSLFPDGVPELPTLPADLEDLSCSPSASSSGDASPPTAYAVAPTVGIAMPCPPTELPGLGKRANDTPVNSSSGSGGSDADMGDPDVKRQKRQERLRRNRESAARSRQKQKERMAGMEATINQLRSEVANKDTEISQLNHENRVLKSQLSFLQGLLSSSKGATPPAATFTGVPPVVKNTAAHNTTATAGVVLLAVVFSFALCVVPGAMEGGLSQWVAGASPSIGGSTPPLAHSRGILSDSEFVVAPEVTGSDKPPMPHMWSPTAAVTFALYATGMHHAAKSVLTHVVAVAVAAACLLLAKTTYEWTAVSRPRRRQQASELPTANATPQAAM